MTEQEVTDRRTEAKVDLQNIIDAFNENFKCWEDVYDFRANFRFNYDPQSGRKTLALADMEPTNKAPITVQGLASAGKIVGEALAQTEAPPGLEPIPKALDLEEVGEGNYPELGGFTNNVQDSLRLKVRTAVNNLVLSIIGEPDMILLTALGIDAKGKILDVFSEECQKLKEETSHGTSGNGPRAHPGRYRA